MSEDSIPLAPELAMLVRSLAEREELAVALHVEPIRAEMARALAIVAERAGLPPSFLQEGWAIDTQGCRVVRMARAQEGAPPPMPEEAWGELAMPAVEG